MSYRLIGMVHLGPLPGAPHHTGDTGALIEAAVLDAERLAAAGFDAIAVENFGDVPFYADDVPKVTIAAMTIAVGAIRAAVDVPVGVNVLRNDALGALAVAAATGAAFIRVNVLTGMMITDQGPITGKAAAVVRERDRLSPDVGILADVFVKHAVPPAGLTVEDAVRDTVERGLADGIIVSGPATGKAPTLTHLRKVRAAAPDTPLYIGSGTSRANIGRFLSIADGVIVGTAVKYGGITTAAVDPKRAAALVAAAATR